MRSLHPIVDSLRLSASSTSWPQLPANTNPWRHRWWLMCLYLGQSHREPGCPAQPQILSTLGMWTSNRRSCFILPFKSTRINRYVSFKMVFWDACCPPHCRTLNAAHIWKLCNPTEQCPTGMLYQGLFCDTDDSQNGAGLLPVLRNRGRTHSTECAKGSPPRTLGSATLQGWVELWASEPQMMRQLPEILVLLPIYRGRRGCTGTHTDHEALSLCREQHTGGENWSDAGDPLVLLPGRVFILKWLLS